jgi:peptide/nickel transport system permease protein
MSIPQPPPAETHGETGPVTVDVGAGVPAVTQDETRTARQEQLRLLVRSKTFLVGAVIVGFWVLCAIFGTLIAPKDPLAANPINDLAPPSGENLFGTDRLGRDVLSRVIVGARDILVVAPLATLLGTVVGVILGLVTGYYRGVVDEVLSRVIDAFLALPVVIIGLVVLVALGPSTRNVILVIGAVFAPIIARTVRAAVLQERELEYVAAARLRNERAPYVLFAEILPNVMGPILVEFTVRLGYAIFTIATLSFLGFGIQPPAPDWGAQIFEHYGLISGGFWWPVLFPAFAIATLVIGFNLLADGITSAFERS